MNKTEWRPLPGYPEYEVSERGELRGSRKKNVLNKKHQFSKLPTQLLKQKKQSRSLSNLRFPRTASKPSLMSTDVLFGSSWLRLASCAMK